MSWFPSFLNPLTAAFAAAVVVPSLLLLYFLKLRRKEMEFASTILWKKSIQDLQVNAPFQKLRQNLLLILQMLLLLLLLLALSRPISHYTPGAGKSSVILIDRSASMSAKEPGGGSRLDSAKRQAKDLVDSMDRNGYSMVIAFDDDAKVVQGFTSDRAALKRAIDSVGPSDRKTNLKLAYQLAEAQVAFIPEQNRTNIDPPAVWLYSDGRVADSTGLSIKSPVTLVQVGSEDVKNIGIVALSAKRNYDRPAEVQIFARLANFGAEPVKAQVQLSISPMNPDNPETDAFVV
ncbi:MAG TPA: VWA domain-containing protein, partial [Tepidisphaeraceae bacterium]|nr:VWA domain-containing protein [Tepidisphaeraceae bacterium]